MMNTTVLTWEQYTEDLRLLFNKVQSSGLFVSAYFGEHAHGMIPAIMLATRCGGEYLDGVHLIAHLHQGNAAAIVLGVCGRGEEYIPYRQYKKIALYLAKDEYRMVEPDIYAREIVAPVVFPYEVK